MPPQALVTTFTPPAYCSSLTSSGGSFYRGQISLKGDSSCYPSSYSQVFKNSSYYSPGICPSGWTTATATQLPSYYYDALLMRNSTETAVQCCPSDYSINLNPSFPRCASSFMAATIKNVIVLGTATSINLATITAAPTAFADSLQVRWQPSDQAVFLALSKPNKSLDRSTRTSAESTSIGESSLHMPLPSVNSSVSNDTATSLYWPSRTWKSSSASKESLDIQIRAKTGIGVGMTVGASIVALVAIIFLWKRKGQKGRRSQARIAGATDNQINCQGHSRGANLSGSGGQEDKAALKTCGADGKARLE